MKTRKEYAAYVEKGDVINHLEHGLLRVIDDPQDRDDDLIRFPCLDEWDDSVGLSVPPFSELNIVESFDDDDLTD